MTNSEGFLPDEVIFLQEYFVYCKEKWCTADGKGPLFGRVDGFQIDPRHYGNRFGKKKIVLSHLREKSPAGFLQLHTQRRKQLLFHSAR